MAIRVTCSSCDKTYSVGMFAKNFGAVYAVALVLE